LNRPFAAGLDLLFAPLAVLGAGAAALVARNPARAAICRRIFDGAGVHPIRHHYYSPLVQRSDLHADLSEERRIAGLDLNEAAQLRLASEFRYPELRAIPDETTASRAFAYRNPMFGPGDAEYLYNMIRYFRPQRIVEIGSGQSTLIARIAITDNASGSNLTEESSYACEHICIEPFENRWLDEIGVTVIRQKVEALSPSFFARLDANDILFIDSSHVIRPQGDVLFEYLSILGILRPGVLVHIHDIFTPRDYPAEWVVNDRKLWNEQYLLEAFLCFNSDFEVLAAVNWLAHHHRDRLVDACPALMRHPSMEPGSFWIRRRLTGAINRT
jgi:predicted O-methyltransferase YrrM